MRDGKYILKKAIGKLDQVGKYYLCKHHQEENMMEVVIDDTKSYFFNNDDFGTFFKRGWSEWYPLIFLICFDGEDRIFSGEQRSNGKKLQVRYKFNDKFIRGEASCHNLDKFDYKKGLKLAEHRLIKNIAAVSVNNWTSIYFDQQKKIDELLKES